MQGYIKLHRQIQEWEWYANPNVMRLFIHFLLKANHADKKWQGKTIKSGSFVTSYEKLSAETGLSVRQVRTALDKLKMTNEVTHEGHTSYSIITLKNWDVFQADDKQNDKQMTTNKNIYIKEKEIYKEKEKKKFVPPSLEEIKNYCQERNNNVDAKQFYDYYTVANWKDKDGKQIKNWKQKVVSWEGRNRKAPEVKPKKWNPYYNVYAEDEYYRRQYGY